MIGYKLFRLRKDGTIGPLFINRKQVLPIGEWIDAEEHLTKGYAFRPGWHILEKPEAPHLTNKGRVWYTVEFKDFTIKTRPTNQGGKWFLAKKMRIMNHA